MCDEMYVFSSSDKGGKSTNVSININKITNFVRLKIFVVVKQKFTPHLNEILK